MFQVAGRWPITAESRIRSQVSRCGLYVRQVGIGIGFSRSIAACQYLSTPAPYLYFTRLSPTLKP